MYLGERSATGGVGEWSSQSVGGTTERHRPIYVSVATTTTATTTSHCSSIHAGGVSWLQVRLQSSHVRRDAHGAEGESLVIAYRM